METKGRAAFYLTWFYMVFSTIVLASEQHLIPDDQWWIFVTGKILIVWMCLPAALLLRRDPRHRFGTFVVGFSMIVYPAFCGYWRINYEMAVFELLVAYALCFRPSRAFFITVSAGSVISFSVVRLLRFDYLRVQYTDPAALDGVLAAIAMGVVATIFYVFLNRERTWREAALTRFGLIGQHASNIIHDVKNLIATPAVHLSTLRRRLDGSRPDIEELLVEMQTSLSRTNRLILDLNEMARLTEPHAHALLSMRKLILEVCDLLQNHLRGVVIDIEGDLELQADRALLYSVMMSLLMNAADQFRRSRTASPRLRIAFGEGHCRIHDNGGGFDPAVLRQLSSDGRSLSTKPDGTGIGLYLVSNALIELGGRAEFSNSGEGGAIIELKFA